MLFFAIQLDEKQILQDRIINLEGAYKCIEDTFAQRDVTLYKMVNGVRYYTRNIDKHDFEYLWMVNSPLRKEAWFLYYIKVWRFIVTDDDTNEVEEEEDLLNDPGVPFIRPSRPYGGCDVLLGIWPDEKKRSDCTPEQAEALQARCEKIIRSGGLKLQKSENEVTYYSGVGKDEFQRLWRVNRVFTEDEELGKYMKRKFIIVPNDTETLEIEGCLADQWTLTGEEVWDGRSRLFLAIKLNEEALWEGRKITAQRVFEIIENTFRRWDVFLHAELAGIHFYTRDFDENDFARLWLMAAKCRSQQWFRDYVEYWEFIITDETGKTKKVINLTESWCDRTENIAE